MAWIESHQHLKEHPKLYRFASILNISRAEAIGHLQCFWWWCIDYAMDGEIDARDHETIARASLFDGDPQVFIDALVQSGFLDKDGDALRVHDWLDYCGELVNKRLQRRKMSAKRRKTSAVRRTNSAKRRKTSAYQPTVPTVPYQPTVTNLPPYIPPELWEEFRAFRREIGKPIKTKKGEVALLREVEKFSRGDPDRAVAIIRQSIDNEWRGIFDLKERTNGANRTGHHRGPAQTTRPAVTGEDLKRDAEAVQRRIDSRNHADRGSP